MHLKESSTFSSSGHTEVEEMEQEPMNVTVPSDSTAVSTVASSSVITDESMTHGVNAISESASLVSDIATTQLNATVEGASDSAVDTDDSVQEDIIIKSEDIKLEVDSDSDDLIGSSVLTRLQQIDLKIEPDAASNSSSSLNGESDASRRARRYTSLTQSLPNTALYKILHSVDTMPLDSDDDDIPTSDRLSLSCFAAIRSEKDDDLTSLAWLQNSDLLKNINAGESDLECAGEDQKENTIGQKICEGIVGGIVPQAHPSHIPYHPLKNADSKPPYSFSSLIFMAIESSPERRLPVKDIYSWMVRHYPYYEKAPAGWKNSVRHNLSLNRCFRKVAKDKAMNVGKGSLWSIDPHYKPNLLQALRKTPYGQYQQLQVSPQPEQQIHQVQGISSGFRAVRLAAHPAVPNNVSPQLFPLLSRRLAQTGLESIGETTVAAGISDIKLNVGLPQNVDFSAISRNHVVDITDREVQDVVYSLMSLQSLSRNSSGLSSDGSDTSSPSSPGSRVKRKRNGAPKPKGPIVVSAPPSDDHIYASPTILDDDIPSGASSIDNEYEFGDGDDLSSMGYPSDWDYKSGDEVDGDAPSDQNRKKLRIDLKTKDLSDEEEEKHQGAKLLLNFARAGNYSDEDKESSAFAQKASLSSSSSSSKKGRTSSSKVAAKSSSSASKKKSSAKTTSTTASKSSSSLSSSSASSSSASSKSSSRSSAKKRPAKKAAKPKSRASPKSAGSAAAVAASSSAKSAVTTSSTNSTPPSRSSNSTVSTRSTPAAEKSTEPVNPAKTVAVPANNSDQSRSSEKPDTSSASSSRSPKVRASIIMTRRGKAKAEAEAKAAAAAAAQDEMAAVTAAATPAVSKGICTRGKKLNLP